MDHISNFSKQSLNERCSFIHEVKSYDLHTDCGVVVISYFIDITEGFGMFMLPTVIPGLIYAGDHYLNEGKLFKKRETRYFDAHSGKELAPNQATDNRSKNGGADQLYIQGEKFYQEGKYTEAYEKFDQAYSVCSAGYCNETKFKTYRDNAKQEMDAFALNADGDILFRQSKFGDARSKYEQAYNMSQRVVERETYKANLETSAELHEKGTRAEQLNREGCEFFDQGFYELSFEKFNQACWVDIGGHTEETKFIENKDMARREINAANFNAEGDRLAHQGKWREAHVKYQQASALSQVTKVRNIYKANEEKIAKILEIRKQVNLAETTDANASGAHDGYETNALADWLNREGDVLFNLGGNYKDAYEKYNQACNTCSVNYSEKQKFLNNRDLAKAEMDAAMLNCEGDDLFRQGKFSEAQRRYDKANHMSKIGKTREKYKANVRMAILAIQKCNLVNQLFKEGEELFSNQRNYREAYDKFCQARNACPANYRRLTNFRLKADEANREMMAFDWNAEGDDLFHQKRYAEAESKYKQAFNKCKVRLQYLKYEANIMSCKRELQAQVFNSQAESLLNQNRFAEAQEKFREAYDRSTVSSDREQYKSSQAKCIKMRAQNFWDDAWLAECNGRFDEAKHNFQEAYKLLQQTLQLVPADVESLTFSNAISLKIERNELFNNGIRSQRNGAEILLEAAKLYQQQEFRKASVKFQESKRNLADAIEKFRNGSRCDRRFEPCVQITARQIEAVEESIKAIEEYITNQKFQQLAIIDDRREVNESQQAIATSGNLHYHQHI